MANTTKPVLSAACLERSRKAERPNGAEAPPETTMGYHIATNDDGDQRSYPGGKGNLYQKIINLIPPHQTFITAFAGNCAILRHKRPARSNIAIDADASALQRLRSNIATSDDATRSVLSGAEVYQFINTNAIDWLATRIFTGNEFVYCDPPYLMSTRRQHRRSYRYELATAAEHAALLNILLKLPCKVMISGYWSELYAEQLADWHSVNFQTRTRGGSWATEYLWMNYPAPTQLHDYTHLGDNYRERERIKRKRNRWALKWAKMPTLERQAILWAMQETEL